VEAEGPIERVKAYLVRTGAADAAFFETVDAEADQLGAGSARPAWRCPDPQPLAIFENVTPGRTRCWTPSASSTGLPQLVRREEAR